MDLEKGQFFLGHLVDEQGEPSGDPLIYDGADLTTHGVIVGMTGSGKTGLGMDLIEEALLSGVPCLIIDPKGDMGNLKLTFPDFLPDDFLPWIDPAEAEREGVSPEELAASKATLWKEGLARAGIDGARLRRIRDNSAVTIYTPGSAAGVPLNVIGSLDAPDIDFEENSEVVRDEIEALVSSLLVLAGVEADPVASPEHILLSTIVEKYWTEGKDLDLAGLVGAVPEPPMRKLGVFDIDTFFPEKERMKLALRLNGLLASPSFSSWLEGVPLDIDAMIGGDGKTKAAVVYLSHLSDSERQFVVTLLLSKLITWFRAKPGTADLRALVYMDEVYGFAPPTAEPPAKKPILTILKQARAHGVGMLLSTQNPVDLDYKAMSNAGTWMVGRLQTENDKKRILGALERATGSVDVGAYDRLITGLDKRQFVLNSTRKPEPDVFATRWAMSYLAGPLTKDQVSSLTDYEPPAPKPGAEPSDETTEPRGPQPSTAAPAGPPEVADGVAITYVDHAAPWSGAVGAQPGGTNLEAAAAATVSLLFDESVADLTHQEIYEAIVFPLTPTLTPAMVHEVDHDDRDFRDEAPGEVAYVAPEARIDTKRFWTSLQTELKNHLVANQTVSVFKNPALKLYSRVGESRESFVKRCADAAEDAADDVLAKLRDKYGTRIERVRKTLAQAELRVRELEADASAKQQEELMSGAGDLLGALLGGKSRSNPLGQAAKRRAASQKARSRAATAAAGLEEDQQELADLEDELAEEIVEITGEFDEKATQIEILEVPLEKTDVRVTDVKLVWIPRT